MSAQPLADRQRGRKVRVLAAGRGRGLQSRSASCCLALRPWRGTRASLGHLYHETFGQ